MGDGSRVAMAGQRDDFSSCCRSWSVICMKGPLMLLLTSSHCGLILPLESEIHGGGGLLSAQKPPPDPLPGDTRGSKDAAGKEVLVFGGSAVDGGEEGI
nr:hypothetical protein CFP56_36259 [Quercus suber]